MWSTQARVRTTASPEQVWACWSEVERWKEWDPSVLSSRLEGPFRAGARGRLKPRGGPAAPFTLSAATEPNAFTTTSRLPLARMDFVHEAVAGEHGTDVLHRIEISGPLAGLFSRLLGKGLARDLEHAVEGLARTAERRALDADPPPVVT